MTGKIFNIQRYSVEDGPGIRTTVFLKGCPLSCTWCHNPEGLSRETELVVVQDRCIGCGSCEEVCPNAPDAGPVGKPTVDRRACLRCGRCVDVCVSGARRLVGETVTADELMSEVVRDRVFYEESGGGVTFSGGEPFDQPEFLLECLGRCREAGLHTAVDTSGHAPRGAILAAAKITDLFLFDLKLLDEDEHLRMTGVPLAPAVENLRALDDSGAEIWVRFPFIPGCTDGEANIESLGRTVAGLRTSRLHILPFHRTARDKYARISRDWRHAGLAGASQESLEGAAAVLTEMGLDVIIGG